MYLNCKIAKHGVSERSYHPLIRLGQRVLSLPQVPLFIIGNGSSKQCVSTWSPVRRFSDWNYSGVISKLVCTMDPRRNVRPFYTTSKWDASMSVSSLNYRDMRVTLIFLSPDHFWSRASGNWCPRHSPMELYNCRRSSQGEERNGQNHCGISSVRLPASLWAYRHDNPKFL